MPRIPFKGKTLVDLESILNGAKNQDILIHVNMIAGGKGIEVDPGAVIIGDQGLLIAGGLGPGHLIEGEGGEVIVVILVVGVVIGGILHLGVIYN